MVARLTSLHLRMLTRKMWCTLVQNRVSCRDQLPCECVTDARVQEMFGPDSPLLEALDSLEHSFTEPATGVHAQTEGIQVQAEVRTTLLRCVLKDVLSAPECESCTGHVLELCKAQMTQLLAS